MKTFNSLTDPIPAQGTDLALWIYNGFDTALTYEIHSALEVEAKPWVETPYTLAKALQAPILAIMQNGIYTNKFTRDKLISSLEAEREWLQDRLNQLAEVVWGKPLNPASPKQVKEFFYDTMGLPKIYSFKGGTRKLSSDRAALEKLCNHFWAEPIARLILKIRDNNKSIGTLKTSIDADSRMRSSYNIAGTETGRLSSSANAFSRGTNAQNITDSLRVMFEATPGNKLAYIDLEQAESRVVAFICKVLFGATAYLEACESDDLHTIVTKMVWDKLPWGTVPDREIADQNFYRDFSYRDMAKRGGHGTNYMGTAPTMASHLKVQKDLIAVFQRNYFRAFPEIEQWHQHVVEQVQVDGFIDTVMGRRRHFFSRPDDPATHREAVAFGPQSAIGDFNNYLMLQVYHNFPQLKILAPVHDAILIEYPAEIEHTLIPAVTTFMNSIPIRCEGHELFIPVEAQTGWNWAKFHEEHNPHGLTKWKGIDKRKAPNLLDRIF